tara:strand:+ start:1054 stop:1305 length:252 start_codon:yes stop_codon:yes gene_type:complete
MALEFNNLKDDIKTLETVIENLKGYHKAERLDFSKEIESIRNRIGDTLDSMVSAEDEMSCARDNLDNIGEALNELEDMLQEHA